MIVRRDGQGRMYILSPDETGHKRRMYLVPVEREKFERLEKMLELLAANGAEETVSALFEQMETAQMKGGWLHIRHLRRRPWWSPKRWFRRPRVVWEAEIV